jgi:hypothetical protein
MGEGGKGRLRHEQVHLLCVSYFAPSRAGTYDAGLLSLGRLIWAEAT